MGYVGEASGGWEAMSGVKVFTRSPNLIRRMLNPRWSRQGDRSQETASILGRM